MTQPPAPAPPTTVGAAPKTADEVNSLVGMHLRQFIDNKNLIGGDNNWLVTVDLTAEPYHFNDSQATLIKSAIADLDSNLDAINMTFINRLVGMFG